MVRAIDRLLLAVRPALTRAALILLALAIFVPLAVERPPVGWVEPGGWVALRAGVVFGLLALVVLLRARLDALEGRSGWGTVGLAVLAAAMGVAHWVLVERHPSKYEFGQGMYLDLLNYQGDAPHQYRLAPYGVTRLLEHAIGDWWLACVAYRWFFNFWLLWAWVRLVGQFSSGRWALASTLALVPLYPLSVAFYMGQLTDPLHHALFVLGLFWIVAGAFWPLVAAVFLGIFAKETNVVLVPAYFVYHAGNLGRTAVLGLASVVAFVAARGLAWRPGFEAINGTSGWMVGTNLGVGEPIAYTAVPLVHNYLHPLLFTLPFVAAIVLFGGHKGWRLWAMTLVVVAAVLLSSLCFSWLYESRNYVPFLPLLLALALPQRLPSEASLPTPTPTSRPTT